MNEQESISPEIEKAMKKLSRIVTGIIISLIVFGVIFGITLIIFAGFPRVYPIERYINWTGFSVIFLLLAAYPLVNAYFAWKKGIYLPLWQIRTAWRYHKKKGVVVYNPKTSKIYAVLYLFGVILNLVIAVLLALLAIRGGF